VSRNDPVGVRERGGREAGSSTARGDSRGPSPSGTSHALASSVIFGSRARAIVECSQRAFGHGALDAALDGLMMQTERPTDRKKRRVFPIGQQ
jgi:hypothetical protein